MKIADSPAHQAAVKRFTEHNNEIGATFNSLGLAFSFEDAVNFLVISPTFMELPDDHQAKIAGLIVAFTVVIEEQRRIEKQRLRVVRQQERKA